MIIVCTCAGFTTDGRLLLGERAEGKSLAGFWETPGGKLEKDESPEQAVQREWAEELNLKLHRVRVLDAITVSGPGVESKLMIMLVAKIENEKELRMDGVSHSRVDLVSLSKAQRYNLTPATARLMARQMGSLLEESWR